MATISTESNGRKRILFVAGDGSRKTIRLGKASRKQAEAFKIKIEALVSAGITGSMDDETSRWIAALPNAFYDRLTAVGLLQPRQVNGAEKLGAFIDGYLAQRPDVKPGTLLVMQQARRDLVRFMGESKLVAHVTVGDADAYKAHLLGRGLAKATVAKWCRYARHYFDVAQRRKMITENPFAHIKGAVRGNTARRVFVPAADVETIIAAVPDAEWKLLIALARYGDLRIPSEVVGMTWRDVDFAAHRFIVRAPKTAHHADGGIRVCPMFPELAKHFQAVYDAAPEGTLYVLPRFHNAGANLRTQFVRYIEAAGLKPWPKPWQNLRASRATELADQFPSHVCAAWLGHTEAIADEFYRQVTDEHFTRAVSAAQNPAQYPAESRS